MEMEEIPAPNEEGNKVAMKNIMSFEEFKMQVFICLVKYNRYTIQTAKDLMKEREKDFPEFWEDTLSPQTTAGGISINLL